MASLRNDELNALTLPTKGERWRAWKAWDYAQANDWAGWDDWVGPNGEPADPWVIEAVQLRESDPAASFRRLRGFASLGSVWSMIQVARCYQQGLGVAKDAEAAEGWYQKAFEAGSQRALLDYGGVLAMRGEDTRREAVYRVGADQDWAPALCRLATCLLEQSQSRETMREVRSLLERAAALGSPKALWLLAQHMTRGQFGLANIPRGVALTWRAGRRTAELFDDLSPSS